MYGYPEVSILLNEEKINGTDNYIFAAKRKQFLGGILKIMLSKIQNKSLSTELKNNSRIEKSLLNELSV